MSWLTPPPSPIEKPVLFDWLLKQGILFYRNLIEEVLKSRKMKEEDLINLKYKKSELIKKEYIHSVVVSLEICVGDLSIFLFSFLHLIIILKQKRR